MPEQNYAGLTVLVFGAAGALGSGVAAAFAAAGASVTGVDKNEPAAQRQLPGIGYRSADVLNDEAVGALITKHALRVMQAAGAGRIVHTASRAAMLAKGSGFAYSVSKLGVLHLVSMAADDVRGTGVTVNCVVPSIIDTPANRAAMPSANHDVWPKVADIARTYLFLAAPESGLVNGAAVPV